VNATLAYILDHTDRVLGCRYHGWSYDTKGKLTKAPGFEDISTFDKSANGLFEVATYTTGHGLIFVNFGSTSEIVPFNEFYKGLEDELDEFDFASFEYVESWDQDGKFNWKTLRTLEAFSWIGEGSFIFTNLVRINSGWI
jgi:phenylpropionate dioxygenase-like ring-hydroxylating dioxygenase large terminal subunit